MRSSSLQAVASWKVGAYGSILLYTCCTWLPFPLPAKLQTVCCRDKG